MSNTTAIEIEIDNEVLNQRGRKYKAVAFRPPQIGDFFIGAGGILRLANYSYDDPRLIVEEVGPFLVTDGKCWLALAEREDGAWFRCRGGLETVSFIKGHGWRRVTDEELESLGGAMELLLKFRAEAKQ